MQSASADKRAAVLAKECILFYIPAVSQSAMSMEDLARSAPLSPLRPCPASHEEEALSFQPATSWLFSLKAASRAMSMFINQEDKILTQLVFIRSAPCSTTTQPSRELARITPMLPMR